MAQLYGELMSSETVAFQERYDFDSMVWQATLVSTYKDKTGIDRNSFCNNQTDQLQP